MSEATQYIRGWDEVLEGAGYPLWFEHADVLRFRADSEGANAPVFELDIEFYDLEPDRDDDRVWRYANKVIVRLRFETVMAPRMSRFSTNNPIERLEIVAKRCDQGQPLVLNVKMESSIGMSAEFECLHIHAEHLKPPT